MKTAYKIDYLAFTWQNTTFSNICAFFGINDNNYTTLSKSMQGYKSGILYKNMLILYDGKPNMGIHVDISAQGLHNIVNGCGYSYLQQNNNITITRLDLAMDVKQMDLINTISMDITLKNYKTRFKTYKIVKNYETYTNKVIGHTIYFGSRQSNVFIRIYNKGLEQKIAADWTRIELEIKGKTANNTFKNNNLSDLPTLTRGILTNYLNFINRASAKNISRCTLQPYWAKILNDTQPLQISPKQVQKTIPQNVEWLKKQVAKTLVKISNADIQANTNFIAQIYNTGLNLQDANTRKQIQDWLNSLKEQKNE